MADDFMSAILGAKASKNRPRFVPGKFNVKVTKIERFDSTQNVGVKDFVFEGEVVDYVPQEGSSPDAFSKGSSVGQVWVSNVKAHPSNIQDFLVGLYKAFAVENGLDPNEITAESLTPARYNAVVGPKSIAVEKGLILGVEVRLQEK